MKLTINFIDSNSMNEEMLLNIIMQTTGCNLQQAYKYLPNTIFYWGENLEHLFSIFAQASELEIDGTALTAFISTARLYGLFEFDAGVLHISDLDLHKK